MYILLSSSYKWGNKRLERFSDYSGLNNSKSVPSYSKTCDLKHYALEPLIHLNLMHCDKLKTWIA